MSNRSRHTETSLVIVESPTKAKTITRYLGPGFTVMASMGHVRDLPVHDLGIDLEHDFEPVYEILQGRRKVVSELKKVAAKSEAVYLATDLDREGEAIAWHLASALDLDPQRTHRVVFNEITKSAIQGAFAAPQGLDMDKVNAQQARRLLDRLVGYLLSPLLQAKIGKGLSAGRVQSVVVRLVVEREQEIRAFVPEESWRITACFSLEPDQSATLAAAWQKFVGGTGDPKTGRTAAQRNKWLTKHGCLSGELIKLGGREFRGGNVSQARTIAEALGFVTERVEEHLSEVYEGKELKIVVLHGRAESAQASTFAVRDIQRRRTVSKPNPPFTTATLQQAASTNLGFGTSRTMRVAQQLYEGVDLGQTEGPVGLITYMRTDSTNLSKDSLEAVRKLIHEEYGETYLPARPNAFGRAKRAQEAHEAIRPSDAYRNPKSVGPHLSSEQSRLYDLIWRRFVACQMTPAQWDGTSIFVGADTPDGEALFRTSGRRLAFDGYLRVMGVSDSGDVLLPDIEVDARLGLVAISPEQIYSAPPARYSEATLVKKLESEGIGRPSTYAPIIQTVRDRGYVELTEKRLHPTPRGEIVTEKLIQHFPKIMDVKFTSFMEEELDKIEEAHLGWVHVLSEFYGPFRESLDKAQVSMEPARAEPSEYTCRQCGKPMVYRIGKNGRFLSCTAYPDCKASMNIDAKGKPIDDVVAEEPCTVCGRQMILRKSRIGPFLGCTGYPECTNTLPCDAEGVALRKVEASDIEETCEECSSSMSVKFARGQSFLGCNGYPKCKATKPMPPGVYVEKPKPVDAGARCDKCGRPMVIRKGRRGPFLSCSGFPRCRNAMPTDKIDHLRALEKEGRIPDPPRDTGKGSSPARTRRANKTNGKVDISALGPPPPGFAWTRTGRPVVETWPEEPLVCPDCGGEAGLKSGRFGPFFRCTAYPKCAFVSNLRGAAKKHAEAVVPNVAKPKPIPTDIPCDLCGELMVIRTGRAGQFLGCSKYPKCRHTKPMEEGATADSGTLNGK